MLTIRAATVAAVPVLLAVVPLTGCGRGGDGSLSADEAVYADAFAGELAAAEGGLGADAAGGRCIGEAIMRELGTRPFRDAGVEPEDLTGDATPGELLGEGRVRPAQARAIARGWDRCVDLPATFATRASAQFRLDAEGTRCLARGLRDDGVLEEYLEVSFTSADPADATAVLDRVTGIVQRCTVGDDGRGGLVVDSIAASLVADGTFDEVQARCVAQGVVDVLGAERLASLGGVGRLPQAPPELQRAFAASILDAARSCDVDVESRGD